MSHAQTAVKEVTVLRLPDEVLTEESLRIVQRCLEEPGTHLVHLDLGGVRLPTAEGLGALVVLSKALRARGGALVLFNVTAATYEVFTLTHLVEVLDVRAAKNQRAGLGSSTTREEVRPGSERNEPCPPASPQSGPTVRGGRAV